MINTSELMYSSKKWNEAQVKFEYERDSRSIFSIPLENETVWQINSMIADILDSDFESDFKENFTSNYEKESLLDNIFLDYFRGLEINLLSKSFYEAFCTLNSIFFVLEYFSVWTRELETNQFEEFFSDLCFYFNNMIISFLSYAQSEKGKKKAEEMRSKIEKLIKEIQNFSGYLKDNLNIKAFALISLDDYKTLSTFESEDLVNFLRDLKEARLEDRGICFRYKEYDHEKLIYFPSNSDKIYGDRGKILE